MYQANTSTVAGHSFITTAVKGVGCVGLTQGYKTLLWSKAFPAFAVCFLAPSYIL